MCHDYHARMSREEELSLLKKRKEQLEEKMKELERQMTELKTEPMYSPQGA